MADKLQSLLRVRRWTLRQMMSAHGDLLRDADMARQRRLAKEAEVARERDRLGDNPFVTYGDYERYARQAMVVLEMLAAAEAEATAAVHASQARLTEAFRAVKAVEEVCERRETAARETLKRVEQGELDALALRRAGAAERAV